MSLMIWSTSCEVLLVDLNNQRTTVRMAVVAAQVLDQGVILIKDM